MLRGRGGCWTALIHHPPPLTLRPQEHSPDASDLLPGVFALAQCWLNEAVLGSFRDDEAQAPVELAGWFNAWHVRLCIMVSELGRA
jgi:hypothetical protein